MLTEIRHRPSFANIRIELAPGEAVFAEASAMASMSASIQMTTQLNGGFFSSLLRRFFGNESMFINRFTTERGGELVLTQSLPGDIECLELQDTTLYLEPGAYLASEPTVQLGLGFAGFNSYFSGQGLFRMKVSGRGKVWFGGYGGIFEREISGDYIVDSGHLLAYEPTISLKFKMAGGLFSSFFSGEGFVTKLEGQGKVYMQSRAFSALVSWTNAYLS